MLNEIELVRLLDKEPLWLEAFGCSPAPRVVVHPRYVEDDAVSPPDGLPGPLGFSYGATDKGRDERRVPADLLGESPRLGLRAGRYALAPLPSWR